MAFRGGVGGVGASLSGRASRVSELVRFAVREAEGSQGRAPRFRSRKDNRQSVRLIRNGFSIRGSRKLYVAKVGELKVAWLRELPSEPSSVSIIKDAAGRYFASFVVETTDVPLRECDAEVGIDLGLAAFAVLSDGKVIESPRFFPRAERNLRKAQHEPGESPNQGCESSREGGRSPQRVGAHAVHDTDSRESSGVCRGFVCRGLVRTRLAKSVHVAGWGMFTRLSEEKAARYGRHFSKVDRWFPSSQMCSVCGRVDGKKSLSVREWTCLCGAVHDRDLNAARNILAAGRAERRNACGETVGLPVWWGARLDETGTHRGGV